MGLPSRGLWFKAFGRTLSRFDLQETTEASVRQEYIDPFWVALGWDVANTAHRSDAEKDVKVEAPVTTVEAERTRNRRPDYIFRIDGFPRFVVEAKKPSLDLTADRDAVFQAKTYAWSAQIPFAIVTNFEQFRLFDATVKPRHDEPERGLIADFDLNFADYPAQWDVLVRTFSREAVAGGSLESLLAAIKKVRGGRRIRGIDRTLIDLRGSEPVDEVFLAHLEDFRLRLASALYRENRSAFPEAETRHGAALLTEAAQRIIDRLVFIRTCEDRSITGWGELRQIVNEAAESRRDVYPRWSLRFASSTPAITDTCSSRIPARNWLFPGNSWPTSSVPSTRPTGRIGLMPSGTTSWASSTNAFSARPSPSNDPRCRPRRNPRSATPAACITRRDSSSIPSCAAWSGRRSKARPRWTC